MRHAGGVAIRVSGSGLLARAVIAALLVALVPAPQARASSDAAVRWTSFSESTSCGVAYTGTPIMSRIGILPDSEPLLGPLGGYFGRSVAAVRSQQVWWTVPMSGGRRVLVHRLALPAFQQVTANLAVEAAAGRTYAITSAAAFVPRTINGARQMSRHTLGISIDINPAQNPYSTDPDRLVTDFPEWFVDAWRDAGFCWGGDWTTAKDAMHFSWMGPAPGSGAGLGLVAPRGTTAPYAGAAEYATAWGGLAGERTMLLADFGGFGALDVGSLREHPAGAVLDVVPGRSGFTECSHYRWFLPAPVGAADWSAMGDLDGDSRTDVVTVTSDGVMTVIPRAGDFKQPEFFTVELPPNPVAITVGDVDGDRRGEVLIAGADGTVNVVDRSGTTVDVLTLPEPVVDLTIGDRDGDGTIELFAFLGGGVVSVLDSTGSSEIERTAVATVRPVAVAAADQDGDGRSDISGLAADGTLAVAVGNTPTGRSVGSWWIDPGYRCGDDPIPLSWDGTFYDDDLSQFAADIELVAELGITLGCNPPFSDAFCPDQSVTRGQMAAFLVRMLGLPETDRDFFVDDGNSVFESDINRLAASGITTGCTASTYCPSENVTRGQMAAFLARALDLEADSGGNRFIDDDQSIFEDQIEALAQAGITRGCDPPRNENYCPAADITRGQMAAFLGRAAQLDR
jgi:hypothetical protein